MNGQKESESNKAIYYFDQKNIDVSLFELFVGVAFLLIRKSKIIDKGEINILYFYNFSFMSFQSFKLLSLVFSKNFTTL